MRLPFLLADFTRIIWHSAEAKEVWAPRISRINVVWPEVERQAVVEGFRDSCLTFVDPQHLAEVSLWAAVRGLVVLPLAINGVASQYSSTSSPVVSGGPFQYRIVLTRPELAARWAQVWKEMDNSAVGELLGYPICCQDFFERVWVEEKGVDTTWEMAVNTTSAVEIERGLKIPAVVSPCQCNIMLRWLGVRLVPHLPCSFECLETVEAADEFASLIDKIDPQVLDWIYEMLEWPIEWSALHGIAEVRTPVLTVSTRTNATGKKLVVQRDGTRYPDEGAQGLRFPFRIVSGKVTDKPSFKRSTQPVHELNGFSTEASMNAAHMTLFEVIPQQAGSFLDLGCGTGRLLERVKGLGWTVMGVEQDSTRAGAGKVPIRRGDLLDTSLWQETYDVVAFMPGRLLENTSREKADEVRQALKTRGRAVLVYAYGDWLSKFGGLGPLLAEAGLADGDVVASASNDGVAAALLVFTTTENRSNGQVTEASVGVE